MKAFLKRLFKIKRYFIVSYHFMCHDKTSGIGFGTTFVCTHGSYVNIDDLKLKISFNKRIDTSTIGVISITEISQKDYVDL